MGAGKKRKQRFLDDNPLCFFCGEQSTTIDHVPSRECFRDRVWPEGYEFPACAACNNGAGPLEQVAALYLLMGNHDGKRPTSQFEKLVAGVRNNTPEFLPKLNMSANAKKRALPLYNFPFPADQPIAKAPIAELPDKNRTAFEAFERRLTCALYYRHMGEVMPITHMIRTHRLQAIQKSSDDLIRAVVPMLPNGIKTNRQNTDIGDQFFYNWYGDQATKMFVFMAQFSLSFVFIGVACRPEDMAGGEDYRPHSNDVADR
ncbi:hypothetical protein EHI46_26245 [Rhizobium leguminosarum]|uniref:hypothetical protein n=1 Tax=Rhizobium leguminosarum TaxID=384 RepID=UPI000FF13102|nr:hypothetical protein [Rhizobium leguminosarum]RWY67868.1 hypothetical protein EHI46_26245 [Rhizobium leguminosarum]